MPFDFMLAPAIETVLDFAVDPGLSSSNPQLLSSGSVDHVAANATTKKAGLGQRYSPKQTIVNPDPSIGWWHEHPTVKRMLDPNVSEYKPLRAIGASSGINGSFHMGLGNGHYGIHKPENGENPEWQKYHGLMWPREVLAWEYAHHLGMANQVPTTIAREHGGVPGSYQSWVDDMTLPLQHEEPYDGPEGFKRAAAFDLGTFNQDRNMANWGVRPNGKLALIDHGLAFPNDPAQQVSPTSSIGPSGRTTSCRR